MKSLRQTGWTVILLIAIPATGGELVNPAPSTPPETGVLREPRAMNGADPGEGLADALEFQRENRINEAVLSLEDAVRASDRNEGWWDYLNPHSDFDVRAANLASVYRDAGMEMPLFWAAARAINSDYAHFAPHLLLANAYSPLRDPHRVDQRLDTLWQSEYLIANLLAPVSAGVFSPYFAHPESLKFTGRPQFGISSETEYWSNGSWRETAVLDGRQNNFSYAFETDYRSENGFRPNQDFEQRILSLKTRAALTEADSFYLHVATLDSTAGDLLHYYNPSDAQMNRRVRNEQEPTVLAGYHHEWSPESHTLVLAGRLHENTRVTDPDQTVSLIVRDSGGNIIGGALGAFDLTVPRPEAPVSYEREFELYQVEVQQIFQWRNHGLQVGARFLSGDIDARSSFGPSTPTLLSPPGSTSMVSVASSSQRISGDYERYGAYGYYQWQMTDAWQLTAGVAYEHLKHPGAFFNPPVGINEQTQTELSPKGGFVWTPSQNITLRAIYAQMLGSVGVDQDYRLEPTQIAGFPQSFGNVIPTSLTEGSLAGPTFDTWQVSYEQRIAKRTFVGVYGEVYTSEIDRQIGAFDVTDPSMTPANVITERITYSERDLTLAVHQLVGECTGVGLRYRVTDADQARFPRRAAVNTDIGSTLHQITGYALINHRSGFFGSFEAIWSQQSNRAYIIDPPGDTFWHFNLLAGYRLPNRQAEVRVGLLNLTDCNYKIAPLNLSRELPRSRTLIAQLNFAF